MSGLKKRIMRDINKSLESQDYEFIPKDDASDEFYMKFTVQEGWYKGQLHVVHIKLNYGEHTYPKQPPLCTFLTPIWHPNIGTTGIICVDTLKEKWTPLMSFEDVFLTLVLLLSEPNPNSPQNSTAGSQYNSKRNEFLEYVKKYYDDKQGSKCANSIIG